MRERANRVKLLLGPGGDGEIDTEKLLTKGFQHGILVLPGTSSLPNERKSAHVRLSFSLLTEEMVHEALRRLRAVVISEREEHALTTSVSKVREANEANSTRF